MGDDASSMTYHLQLCLAVNGTLLEMVLHLDFYWEVTSHLQSELMGDDASSPLSLGDDIPSSALLGRE